LKNRIKFGLVSKSGKIAWKEEKTSLRQKSRDLPLYEAMQIVVLFITILAFIAAAVYYWMEDWRVAAKAWMLVFFCMYLVWILERRKRLESDYIRANLS